MTEMKNVKYRKYITRLRLRSLGLKVETSMYSKTEACSNICECCTLGKTEDECHFVLICPLYTELRERLIPIQYQIHASHFSFIRLMSNAYKNELLTYNLAKFVCMAYELRQNHLLHTVR